MNDPQPTLSEQAVTAYRKQMDHISRSVQIDRTGWTQQQWIDDARTQFSDLDGTVMSLVNGHVTALLREIDIRIAALRAMAHDMSATEVAARIDNAHNTPLTPYVPVDQFFERA